MKHPGLRGQLASEPRCSAARRGAPLYDLRMPLLVAVRDLLFRSKIDEAARRVGVAVRFAPRDRPLAAVVRELGGGTLLADLNAPEALDGLRAARDSGTVHAVGFMGHAQQELADAAAAAGAEVLTRGQLVARLDALVRDAGEPNPS
jgi:hypothetical protein